MSYSLEKDFLDYMEHLIKQTMDKAEIELRKARESKDLLELPQRKENWDIQEDAEQELDEHFKKALSYFKEVAVLMRGIEVFKNGLIYEAMKDIKFLKGNKVDIE